MDQIMGPQFNGTADYDCIVQATFKDIQDFVNMKADPFFKEKVAPDHENFADTTRSKYVFCSFCTCYWRQGKFQEHVILTKLPF
jgi:hypothetical protein